mgnify:FL=1
MALLTLKNIGKIYVSEGNVAVGIRGVNLTFDRGEFVAVTGKSGSGKSTLLSVISGMDTYEEGDLLIEGKSTAHYTQPDWEEYRQKYISFIFQDYNIIESFTVLQNVELALMHITDPRERRRRAMELIRRVGLSDRVRQKGSKLSGGQKQRTVIARALAKDSPIILADEPTGNLDSATGKEIIELLREVSKDKLVIVVTHNFEQVEYCATRHIRVYDGAIESDHVISAPSVSPASAAPAPISAQKGVTAWHGGRILGRSMFASRPKLTAFMCLLMAVGMLGLFFATSMFDSMNDLFEPHRMFRHVDGRVIFTRRDGAPMTDEEVRQAAETYGAKTSLHYDRLIDSGNVYVTENGVNKSVLVRFTYGEKADGKVYGRYPEAADEVLLCLPIYMKPAYGTNPEALGKRLEPDYSKRYGNFRVVGVSYYYDNTKDGKAIFSESGYNAMLGAKTLLDQNSKISATVTGTDGKEVLCSIEDIRVDSSYSGFAIAGKNLKAETIGSVTLQAAYYVYNYISADSYGEKERVQTWTLDTAQMKLGDSAPYSDPNSYTLIIGGDLAASLAAEYLSLSYRQASLFFENDRAAKKAAEKMCGDGFIAVTSDTAYSPDPSETILATVLAIFTLFEWVLVVLFLAFFINLCSSRTIGTFRGDLAIMRSMGIPVKVIRVAMYVRMLLSLIPACVLLAVCSVLVYTIPQANAIFPYLHLWQYLILAVGMLLITLRVTHKQIRRLFGQSVKKALKGGNAE